MLPSYMITSMVECGLQEWGDQMEILQRTFSHLLVKRQQLASFGDNIKLRIGDGLVWISQFLQNYKN